MQTIKLPQTYSGWPLSKPVFPCWGTKSQQAHLTNSQQAPFTEQRSADTVLRALDTGSYDNSIKRVRYCYTHFAGETEAQSQVSNLPKIIELINVKARKQSDCKASTGQAVAFPSCTPGSQVITHISFAVPLPPTRLRKQSSQIRRASWYWLQPLPPTLRLPGRALPIEDTASEFGRDLTEDRKTFNHQLLKPLLHLGPFATLNPAQAFSTVRVGSTAESLTQISLCT